MALRDSPRPDGYWPNTPTQWREASIDDCTWYATEFAFEAASIPHKSFHPVLEIRALSSDRVGGTPVEVALRDTYRLWPKQYGVGYTYGAEDRATIERALATGATIVTGGDYEKLPLHYRRWTNNDKFDHSMANRDLSDSDRTFLYDPLGGGPQRAFYDGEWIPLKELLDYNWGLGPDKWWVGIVDNKRKDYLVQAVTITPRAATAGVRLANKTPAFTTPTVISDVKRRFYNPERIWETIARGPNGWRLVVWTDDQGALQSGWVAKSDILEVVAITPEAPPADVDELQENYDKLLAEHADLQADLADITAQNSELINGVSHIRSTARDLLGA